MKKNNGVLSSVFNEDLILMQTNPSEFWESIVAIGNNAFANSDSLKEIIIPDSVTSIGGGAFRSCSSLTTIDLPLSLTEIGDNAFDGCSSLTKIDLPLSLTKIGGYAFEGCSSLTKIDLPPILTKIDHNAFNGCSSLTKIDLPDGVTEIGYSAFNRCSSLTTIHLPDGVTEIGEKAFQDCSSLTKIDLPPSLTKIGHQAFSGCISLTKIDLPDGVTEIGCSAFKGCSSLKEIIIPKSVSKLDVNAFKGLDFNYISKTKDGQLILSKEPSNRKDIVDIQDCTRFKKFFTGAQISDFISKEVDVNILEYLATKLEKTSDTLPFSFVEKILNNNQVQNFVENFELKNFKHIQKIIPNNIKQENLLDFYVFAYDLGCFSKNEKLNNQANSWLKKRIEGAELPLNDMHQNFESWLPEGENLEFSDFLFNKSKEKKTSNFDKILQCQNWGQFLRRIYEEYKNPETDLIEGGRFRDIKTGELMFAVFHNAINEQGQDVSKRKDLKPTIELFQNYFATKTYDGIKTDSDKAIAQELAGWPVMGQQHFDRAKSIMDEFNSKNIDKNIVGKHLRDLSLEIEEYKRQTEELAKEGFEEAKEIVGKLTNMTSEFTFDWLEKNDPKNFCLGLFCDCCSNLAGVGYGIMRSSFVHPDVQNLVIKNKKGIPVAKSTLYVNRKQGYGVFNNVEVSSNITSEQKQLIYKAYRKGINAFAEEYNKQNPDNPLKKISVGIHLNDLSEEIIKGNKPCEILQGINFGDYGINANKYSGDWDKGSQYLVWESTSKNAREGELIR